MSISLEQRIVAPGGLVDLDRKGAHDKSACCTVRAWHDYCQRPGITIAMNPTDDKNISEPSEQAEDQVVISLILEQRPRQKTVVSGSAPSPQDVERYYMKLDELARAHQTAEVRGSKMLFR